MKVTIGVIGKNEQHKNDRVDDTTMKLAEEVGRRIAEAGAVLVTGGRKGVMEASSKGAREAGGLTIGFLPGMERSGANPFVDIIFPTGLGRARNLLTARSCDALVMIGGSCGTLNELTIAYAEARPVVILEGSGGWADKIRSVLHKDRYLDERETVEISFAKTAADAVAIALRRATAATDAKPDQP